MKVCGRQVRNMVEVSIDGKTKWSSKDNSGLIKEKDKVPSHILTDFQSKDTGEVM